MHPNDGGPKQAPQAGAYPPSQAAYGYQQTAPPPAAYNYQQGQGQWTTGLCDCFEDPSNCFTTCCCPCITFGQNAEVIDKGLTTCGSGGLIYYLLTHVGCSCLYSFPYRTKLRGLYSLPEDPCTDCCVHCMFSSCALCQEYRELKNRGLDPSIGWIANAQKMNQGAPPHVTPGMFR